MKISGSSPELTSNMARKFNYVRAFNQEATSIYARFSDHFQPVEPHKEAFFVLHFVAHDRLWVRQSHGTPLVLITSSGTKFLSDELIEFMHEDSVISSETETRYCG